VGVAVITIGIHRPALVNVLRVIPVQLIIIGIQPHVRVFLKQPPIKQLVTRNTAGSIVTGMNLHARVNAHPSLPARRISTGMLHPAVACLLHQQTLPPLLQPKLPQLPQAVSLIVPSNIVV